MASVLTSRESRVCVLCVLQCTGAWSRRDMNPDPEPPARNPCVAARPSGWPCTTAYTSLVPRAARPASLCRVSRHTRAQCPGRPSSPPADRRPRLVCCRLIVLAGAVPHTPSFSRARGAQYPRVLTPPPASQPPIARPPPLPHSTPATQPLLPTHALSGNSPLPTHLRSSPSTSSRSQRLALCSVTPRSPCALSLFSSPPPLPQSPSRGLLPRSCQMAHRRASLSTVGDKLHRLGARPVAAWCSRARHQGTYSNRDPPVPYVCAFQSFSV